MRPALFGWIAAAAALPLARPGAQEWTVDELDQRLPGFHLDAGPMARLEQIAELVRQQGDARAAIVSRIHGEHREYLLKIQRLIDQLTDERWLERERAERELIEIGSRARGLLEERQRTGALLEERLRCERIIARINEAGDLEEQRQLARLRGLVATAYYLDRGPGLQRALLSALGHTDPEVRREAVRALGVQGEGEDANALVPFLDVPAVRRTALAAVARMRGERALSVCADWLRSGALSRSESLTVVRVLRGREDSAALLAELAGHADPVVAAAASLPLRPSGGSPSTVSIELDGVSLEERFVGMTGDGVVLSSPVEGLERIVVPTELCDVLEFRAPRPTVDKDSCRVFLKQGTLVVGKLAQLRTDTVLVQSPVFGAVEIPRTEIQGIAFDPQLDRLIGASTDSDRIRLKTQPELISGDCREIAGDHVVVRTAEGERRLPLADVAGILFQRPLHTPAEPELFTRVDLVAGDRVFGYMAGVDAGSVALVVPLLGNAVVPIADVARMELEVGGGALWGFTLIADYADNKLIEVDDQGKEVFVMEEVYGAWDVECLDSGNLLITEFSVSRVQEVTRSGEPVWTYEDLRNPYDADRLANGNTLIADTFRGRVIEVSPGKEVVWEYAKDIRPFDVDRLANGNTLIADVLNDRVIEVDPQGAIVWEKLNVPSVHDADRLPNGNTLITLRTLNRVIEVDPAGREVFCLDQLQAPSDADRLPNGNTIVAEHNAVREFDRNRQVVWQKPMTWAVEANRY